MSISLQTNVASLVAQNNLSITTDFQSRTIERLTSGFRINKSGDDAAGLAVANKYRSNVAELTQGILNANNGASSLQTIDGGLNNISMMLDRLKTLATESASTTFTGDRGTLNTEYQNLTSEIDRQAQNIQLNQGGAYNQNLSVYIGGAVDPAITDATVSVDLSGQAVDSGSLGLSNTSVAGGGNVSAQSSGYVNLLNATTLLANNETQQFVVNYTNSSGVSANTTVTVKGTGTGITVDNALGQINSQLAGLGITASVNPATTGPNAGGLEFSGSGAFSVNGVGTTLTDGLFANGGVGTMKADNLALYNVTSINAPGADPSGETFSLVTTNNQTVQITLGADTTTALAVADINKSSMALGITASVNSAGKIELSSTSAFTMVETSPATAGVANSLFGATTAGTIGNVAVAAPAANSSTTGNALSALTAIQAAVQLLGVVQGKVGAGENKLQYAIDLANSEVTNFSAAESHIRDADVAAEAANLTKAQVLQQASIAAMAQANSAPQAVLKPLQG